jgi:SAM-dependent methyltransferase
MTGVIGGRAGYELIKRLGGSPPRRDPCSGDSYRHRSKVEVLLGPGVWDQLRDKVVLDFGCGHGEHAIEMAQRGARKVIGLDIRERVLEVARNLSQDAGVADRCVFTTHTDERVDAVISLDSFEHFADPADVLQTMGRLLRPGGRVLVAFGPPWYHPKGGHLFSIFPWAHLVFSEAAFMRWWGEFKTDGATRFSEIDGGLNQMSVSRFRQLVEASGLECERLEPVPIRKTRWIATGPMREFFTSVVRCTLRAPDVAIVSTPPRTES